MVEIKEVTSYLYNGVEYKSLKEVRVSIDSGLGGLIDSISNVSPQTKLDILDLIIDNHKELVNLLTVVIDVSDDALVRDHRNLLDIT